MTSDKGTTNSNERSLLNHKVTVIALDGGACD